MYGLAADAASARERAARALRGSRAGTRVQPTALCSRRVSTCCSSTCPELPGASSSRVARALLPGPVHARPARIRRRRFAWLPPSGRTRSASACRCSAGASGEVVAALGAVVATSANLPGGRRPAARSTTSRQSSRRPSAVVVDGGELPGMPSTVRRPDRGRARVVLREGAVPAAEALARAARCSYGLVNPRPTGALTPRRRLAAWERPSPSPSVAGSRSSSCRRPLREAADRDDRSGDVGRGDDGRRHGQGRPGRGGDELVRRIRHDDLATARSTDARSAGNGPARSMSTSSCSGSHDRQRPITTGSSRRTRSGRAVARTATFTTRAAPAVVTADACGASGRTSATVGGTVEPERQLDGLVDRVRHQHGVRLANRHRVERAQARARCAVSLRLNGLRGGRRRTTSAWSPRTTSARPAAPTGHVPHRPGRLGVRPAARTRSPISSARLTGTVNPNGRGTTAWFEYGTTTSLGTGPAIMNAGFGTRSTRRRGAASPGLQPGTRYYYRARRPERRRRRPRADTGPSRPARGPLVSHRPASRSTGATVVLTGNVDPDGRSTSWWFELGHDDLVRHDDRRQERGLGARRRSPSRRRSAGLTPGIEYHARLVARELGRDDAWRRRRLPHRRACRPSAARAPSGDLR